MPAVKAGLKLFLETTEGLRRTPDGVTVRASDPEPREMTSQLVVLGNTTTTQGLAGLNRREETATLTCLILVTKVGVGDSKATEARDRAYELEAAITAALAADRTAARSVPPPGQLAVTGSTLAEYPVDWDESPARRAQLELTLSWTSHIL